ncbi:hypothetical protein IFR05_013601 [Cadophora sp. M221]|nr:hypothetical protein IFR05_013601 [Cadophora sp. M221]
MPLPENVRDLTRASVPVTSSSLLQPFKEEHRSVLGRGSTAIGQVFGAMSEHPAVGSVAWDVVLTDLSLGIWSAVRGLDARDMLRSSILFMNHAKKPSEGLIGSNFGGIKTKAENAISKIDVSTDKPRRGPGRPKKKETKTNRATEEKKLSSAARRRKGLAGKGPSLGDRGIQKNANGRTYSTEARDSDDEYAPPEEDKPTEGDNDADEDFETAAPA